MEVKEKIIHAYLKLLSREAYLFIVGNGGVNERSITHYFAIYLQKEFPEFNVDCEYNKDNKEPKRLRERFEKSIASSNIRGDTVYPDIIIHHRGTKNNFIVIEAKKTSVDLKHKEEDRNCPCDKCKLKFYKQELNYQYAFFIQFPVGEKFKNLSWEVVNQYIEDI